MSIKQLLKAAYELGKADATPEQFQEWYELQGDTNKIIEASTSYVETRLGITVSTQTKTVTHYNKNVITPGSVINCGGDFHLGDKK